MNLYTYYKYKFNIDDISLQTLTDDIDLYNSNFIGSKFIISEYKQNYSINISNISINYKEISSNLTPYIMYDETIDNYKYKNNIILRSELRNYIINPKKKYIHDDIWINIYEVINTNLIENGYNTINNEYIFTITTSTDHNLKVNDEITIKNSIYPFINNQYNVHNIISNRIFNIIISNNYTINNPDKLVIKNYNYSYENNIFLINNISKNSSYVSMQGNYGIPSSYLLLEMNDNIKSLYYNYVRYSEYYKIQVIKIKINPQTNIFIDFTNDNLELNLFTNINTSTDVFNKIIFEYSHFIKFY